MFSNFIDILYTNYFNSNYLTAIVAGVSAKLYDDIIDNKYLESFKNETLLEALKGVQFITTTKLSIQDPFFIIVYYIGNFANFIGDNNSFKDPYEKSLLYSYLCIFFLLDYKKIISTSVFQYIIIVMFIIGMYLESRIYRSECSAFKLLCRLGSILSIIFMLYVFPNACTTLKYLWFTIMYSLFVFNDSEHKNNVEYIKQEVQEEKEIQEEKEVQEVREEKEVHEEKEVQEVREEKEVHEEKEVQEEKEEDKLKIN
jgi:hypothetical protein